ncbi:hypothetical protein B6N60_00103 [Richelia sinica FACHB-800]|uniref:Uncharacterized protein n=1 Tax=Richelia sinica FACHB-800 TaxID=1357546 RepID=A0A975T3L3_9NOST|nr:hypothetical protein B6N60_00103 [Richelia sinica FACHB-800]
MEAIATVNVDSKPSRIIHSLLFRNHTLNTLGIIID